MSNINKPAVKPILLGKKIILKPDKVPTIGSDSLVTSGALAEALQNKNVALNDSSDNIIPTGDIIIGRLGEDSAFYIINPNFLGTKWMKLETPKTGKLYYDKFTHTYYTFQGNILEDNVGIVGYKFEPLVLPSIVKVTWQELKDLRDNSKLIPGLKYRITDYQCTTTQENTQSAGHQFDIVLLALSENKLAEEGWAMEHPTDVYDVTFADGVTIKCYLYKNSDGNVNIVRTSDLLGFDSGEAFEDWEQSSLIDYNNKTLTFNAASNEVDWVTNLQYNYFQNSNLSAWKVWYCLDNDTERFSWAQEAKNEITSIKTGTYPFLFRRDNSVDTVVSSTPYYGWKQDDTSSWIYTTTETPKVGDSTWAKGGPPGQFIPMQNPDVSYVDELNQPEGKGVIYRLIDEWNNDIPYDFKNILIYNETYSQYCYAIIDNTENNFDVDPTLYGTKVKAIHVLCDNNDELKPIAKGVFGNNPLVNIIFLNNNTLADEYSDCVVSNGLPIVS